MGLERGDCEKDVRASVLKLFLDAAGNGEPEGFRLARIYGIRRPARGAGEEELQAPCGHPLVQT